MPFKPWVECTGFTCVSDSGMHRVPWEATLWFKSQSSLCLLTFCRQNESGFLPVALLDRGGNALQPR